MGSEQQGAIPPLDWAALLYHVFRYRQWFHGKLKRLTRLSVLKSSEWRRVVMWCGSGIETSTDLMSCDLEALWARAWNDAVTLPWELLHWKRVEGQWNVVKFYTGTGLFTHFEHWNKDSLRRKGLRSTGHDREGEVKCTCACDNSHLLHQECFFFSFPKAHSQLHIWSYTAKSNEVQTNLPLISYIITSCSPFCLSSFNWPMSIYLRKKTRDTGKNNVLNEHQGQFLSEPSEMAWIFKYFIWVHVTATMLTFT